MVNRNEKRKAAATALPSVSVIGLGNWGISLANALHRAGIPLAELVTRRRSTRRSLLTLPIKSIDRAAFDASILWLCVPDSAIAEVTRGIVKRSANRPTQMRGQIVVHSSGALNTTVLGSASRAGAAVASVHPVMTFPSRNPVSLTGVPFGIEADASTRRLLNVIVRRLGGEPFPLNGSTKAFYHMVGMMASPLLVSLIAAAEEAAGLAGLSPVQRRRVIEPIARATIENIFTRGKANSFSGPVARGDLTTIHLHLKAMMPHPILAAVYRSLALYAVEALPARNSRRIRSLLNGTVPRKIPKGRKFEGVGRHPQPPAP